MIPILGGLALGGVTRPTDRRLMPFLLGGESGSPSGTISGPTIFYVSASSTLRYFGTGGAYKTPIDVSAASGFAMAARSVLAARYYGVSASNGLKLRSVAAFAAYRAYDVSASNGLKLRSAASSSANRVYDVSASGGFTLRSAASSTRAIPVSASSSFVVSPSSTSGRDLFVSASTSMRLSATPKSNRFFNLDATASFVVTASASMIATGTLAHSGFTLTGHADAVVVLPWRYRPLTLSPGGNIPHS